MKNLKIINKDIPFLNEIIHGDCIKVMKKIPSNSIAVCITDPPYNYEFAGHKWDSDEIKRRTEKAQKSSSILVKNLPYGSGLSGGVRNERWYERNRNNIVEYGKWVESWGSELFRILKPGGLVFTFNSSRTVAHVQVSLENIGFYTRDILVWKRNSGIPKGLNLVKKLEKMGLDGTDEWQGWHSCLRSEWEAISVVQKPLINNYVQTLFEHGIGLFKAKTNEGFKSNIIDDIKKETAESFNNHITIKPMKLIENLIELSVPRDRGNIVIDPFVGSGTTAAVAKKANIDFIGIEINQEYVEIANQRLAKVEMSYV
jgi:site-specific DNA-methyltransferase (adenine-specific)